MATLFNLLIAAFCVTSAFAAQVCYDDLDCFTDDTFCSDNNFPPWEPSRINTHFFLYTRSVSGVQLDRTSPTNLKNSGFQAGKKTKYIIHGYTDSTLTKPFLDMMNAFLTVEDCNVILVDWANGADALYDKARQNIRVVGREVGELAKALVSATRTSMSNMHCVGHSLGAHTCGYAGEWQPGFGRITGLDPAGPGYRDVLNQCKLDKTDASFVDNLHTDGDRLYQLGFGIEESLGHADFFPNGGLDMPGCFLDGVCDHSRALEYFTESITTNSCRFKAYKCNYDSYIAGTCNKLCNLGSNCSYMGYYADTMKFMTGDFYLDTYSKSPYCKA